MGVSIDLRRILSDPARIEALDRTELLDSSIEETFDRFTRVTARMLGVPVALVSLVDEDRQFFKSQVGLPEPWATARETPLSHSFCQHVVAEPKPLVVVDARAHPLLAQNLAIRDLGIVAYLGVPLSTSQGATLGSLCAIDSKPREWSQQDIDTIQAVAAFVLSEIELRLATVELRRKYNQVRELEVQRRDMVDMLVHDLRNPLTSLLGGLELLEAGPELSPSAREDVALSLAGGKSLLRMVNNILDVSRAEAGVLEIQAAPVDPAALVDEVVQQLKYMAMMARVELKVDVVSHVVTVQADAEMLRRILVNLVANAVQHTDAGGRVVISARSQYNPDRVLFEVADTGRGIASADLAGIFEKFNAASARTRRGRTSTGLGLAFCKMAVAAHGGTIIAESTEGYGSVFRVTIPVSRSSIGRLSTAAPEI